jgi:hypothetical protein
MAVLSGHFQGRPISVRRAVALYGAWKHGRFVKKQCSCQQHVHIRYSGTDTEINAGRYVRPRISAEQKYVMECFVTLKLILIINL